LIDQGADVTARDKDDHTALIKAQQFGYRQIELLLEKVSNHGRQSI
jgi:hypothetical protein